MDTPWCMYMSVDFVAVVVFAGATMVTGSPDLQHCGIEFAVVDAAHVGAVGAAASQQKSLVTMGNIAAVVVDAAAAVADRTFVAVVVVQDVQLCVAARRFLQK